MIIIISLTHTHARTHAINSFSELKNLTIYYYIILPLLIHIWIIEKVVNFFPKFNSILDSNLRLKLMEKFLIFLK